MNRFEREEKDLEKQLKEGTISKKEFHVEMHGLRKEKQEMAIRAAEKAYDDEMNRWEI